jgi:hypothetical protein
MPIVTSLFPEHDIVQALPTCLAADQLTEVGKTVSYPTCSLHEGSVANGIYVHSWQLHMNIKILERSEQNLDQEFEGEQGDQKYLSSAAFLSF